MIDKAIELNKKLEEQEADVDNWKQAAQEAIEADVAEAIKPTKKTVRRYWIRVKLHPVADNGTEPVEITQRLLSRLTDWKVTLDEAEDAGDCLNLKNKELIHRKNLWLNILNDG